jgi:hypothetical protein
MNNNNKEDKNNKRSVEKPQQSVGKEVRENTGEKNQLIKKKIPLSLKAKDNNGKDKKKDKNN